MRAKIYIFFSCFFVIIPVFTRAQSDGVTAKFTFNSGIPMEEISGRKAIEVGASLVDDRFGNPRSAFFLHGSAGSYLNLGTGREMKPRVGSISLWFNIDNAIEAGEGYELNPILVTKCSNADDFYEAYCIYYMYKVHKLDVSVTQSSLNQVGIHSNLPVSLTEWHHAVLTFDHDFLSFYYDGKLETRLAKNFDNEYLVGDSVMVGNSANTKNKRFFNGAVDDIMIFNRVLTIKEVKELYEAPNPNRFSGLIRWICVAAGLTAFAGFTFFFFNRRYKKALQKEIEKNELRSMVYETEIKVLKANMNPHFIFNALNSVQKYILSNDKDNAYRYLAKFSKLLRKLLESNIAEYISLEEEIDILNYYLEMESLRFEKAFSYRVIIDPKLIAPRIFIPHMLIQPFVENAIWHGLLHKSGAKDLDIEFTYLDEKRIVCRIEDNGVGRGSAGARSAGEEKKSLALSFNKQRLELIKKTRHIDCGFDVIDKIGKEGQAAGTIVHIIIPLVN